MIDKLSPVVPRHPASQMFHDLCNEMKRLHDRKQADYGRETDPFANVRATEEWGQPGWVGAMIRATDKLRRLQKVAQGGTLANEGVEDSLMDLAVYSIIALVLWRQDHPVPVAPSRTDLEALWEGVAGQADSRVGPWLTKNSEYRMLP